MQGNQLTKGQLKYKKLILPVLVGLFLWPVAGFGQDSAGAFAKAHAALESGQYIEAREVFRSGFDAGALGDGAAIRGYVETFVAKGEYELGLNRVDAYLAQASDNPYFHYGRGRLLIVVGRYDDAEQALVRAYELNSQDLETLLLVGDLMMLTGRGNRGYRFYNEIVNRHAQESFRDSPSLALAARSYARLGDFHEANQIFRTAYQVNSRDTRTMLWWGELFQEKFNNADARRTFEEALAVNPHSAELYVAYAGSHEGFGSIGELASKALIENPNHVEAMNSLAEIQIIDSDYDKALEMLKQALQINPSHELTLANLASVHHLSNNQAEFLKIEQQMAVINPSCTTFYTSLAQNCIRRFRYQDAVDFYYRAITKDRRNWEAYTLLGTNLLRVGKIAEARQSLEQAFRGDPFNLYARNSLELLDEYENFDTVESENFSLLIHNSETAVLAQPILTVAEACFDSLSRRYPYRPAQKIRIEAYNDHDDFAVRISGLPGIGLLGVCFGDVLAIDTPKAQAGTQYNWSRTLWHELAHVMAIGLSDHKVPRWFTEGLSVFEETLARPEWRRQMDLEIFAAYDQDLLLKFADINRGFTRPTFPEQTMLTYYQSAKWIEYISKRHGFQSIVALLQQFAQGRNLEEAFQQALDQDVSQVEKMLFDELKLERAGLAPVLVGLPPMGPKKHEQSFTGKLFESSNPLFDNIKAGYKHLQQEELTQAEARFKKAIEVYPSFTAGNNAYQGLAEVHRRRGDTGKLMEVLADYLRVAEFGAAEARELAGLYDGLGDVEKAEIYLRRSLDIEPYDLRVHVRLAEIYRQRQAFAREIHARKAVLALQPVDRAGAYFDLAMSLYDNGQRAEAKLEVLRSLDLAPGYRDAQRLLLKCVGSPE